MGDNTQNVAAQKASAEAAKEAQNKPQTKATPTRYYMPYNGSRFITTEGKTLTFVGGCLEVDIQEDIDEIEKAIKVGAAIYKNPMGVVKSDAYPMREVGPSGRGATTSQTIADLARDSGK